MTKINKIVIVGGGSAGWMTAAMLIKNFPEKNIIVMESPNIPTVGVGESTYDGINYFLEYLEIDKKSFFALTDASIKLGLDFVDFYKKDSGSFLYPFGRACVDETLWGMQDWMIKKYVYPDIPITDFAESYFPVAHLINENTFYDNKDNRFPNYDPRIHTALHFDAIKFANWLKTQYCIPKGVQHIISEVLSVNVDENGISSLNLENNKKIEADLFIDCTGFKSLLLSKTMNEKFISYEDQLPNNRAWATQINYKEKYKELETTTRCTAIENGWVWNIPLWSRIGAGYVYSDKFTSKEDALEQFKKYLCSNKMKIPRTREEIEKLTFKDISMRVGIHERIWVKNVVAIGLSAGFIEPLESNGLFTVQEFLFKLVRALLREETTSWDIKIFNQSCRDLFQGFAEFIRLHYAMSIRDDTPYWVFNSERDYNFDNFVIKDIDSANTLNMYKLKTKEYTPNPNGGFPTGMACISTGMHFDILDKVQIRMGEINYNFKYKEKLNDYFDNLDKKKNKWLEIAKNSPSLTDYLKETYYS